MTLLRDAAKTGTPSSAGRSSQLTAVPWRPRVRWAVARIGERELSGAGSASEQAQFVQKPNGFTNTVSSVVCCSLRDFSFTDTEARWGFKPCRLRDSCITLVIYSRAIRHAEHTQR
jgi:hypothetical protein